LPTAAVKFFPDFYKPPDAPTGGLPVVYRWFYDIAQGLPSQQHQHTIGAEASPRAIIIF
jgi:hypothetical protein